MAEFNKELCEKVSEIASNLMEWEVRSGYFWSHTDSTPFLPVTVDGNKIVPFNEKGIKLRKKLGKNSVELFMPMTNENHLQLLIDYMLSEDICEVDAIKTYKSEDGYYSKLIHDGTNEVMLEHEFSNSEEESIFQLILKYYGKEIS